MQIVIHPLPLFTSPCSWIHCVHKVANTQHVPWPCLTGRPACPQQIVPVRAGQIFKRPSVKTAVQMKWIKAMNRDPISPEQERDTQRDGAGRKSINANGVLDALRWLQDKGNFILHLNERVPFTDGGRQSAPSIVVHFLILQPCVLL